MIRLDGQLETDDMTFAVVLALSGFNPRMERRERGVFWIVGADDLDEDMASFLDHYHTGMLTVEPRRFARELTAMRKDVYRLMGVTDNPQGTRVRPSRSSNA